ncbi:hypothetical protein TOTORO_02930 [Serratia phage vB_SmaS-Totoro]|nr:hypothetical protein TOTORO_02930 [Serratia phage vB_SmaS-Totoro]
MDEIVRSVPGVFSFIGSDGRDLRELAMELNSNWAMYIVKRNGDNARLSELEKTLEKIKTEGIDRQSMTALESLSDFSPLDHRYPLSSYTLKPSMTNSNVAVEEVNHRIIGIAKNMVGRLVEFIKKIIQMIKEKLPSFVKRRERQKEGVEKRNNDPRPTEFMSPEEIKSDEELRTYASAMDSAFNVVVSRLADPGDRLLTEYQRATHTFEGDLKDMIQELDRVNRVVDKLSSGGNVSEEEVAAASSDDDIVIDGINRFSGYLGTRSNDNRQSIRAIKDWFTVSSEEHRSLDVMDVAKVQGIVDHLTKVLSASNSPLIIPDNIFALFGTLGTKLEDVSAKLVSVTDKLDTQSTTEWPEIRSLISTVERISNEHFNILRFFQFSEDMFSEAYRFFVISDEWLRKIGKK